MANLANIFNHQGLKCGLNAIVSYAKAKKYVHEKQKNFASGDLYSALNKIILKKKG